MRSENPLARRVRLEQECVHRTGWRVEELADYFLITDVDDRAILRELERAWRAYVPTIK